MTDNTKQETKPRRMSLDSFLTCSAGDWFAMTGENPRDYVPVGVYGRPGGVCDSPFPWEFKKKMAYNRLIYWDLPENTKVVTNIVPVTYSEVPHAHTSVGLCGTALVRKDKALPRSKK